MTLLELTNLMTTAISEVGNPPVAKSFPVPIALSADIYLGNVQVR